MMQLQPSIVVSSLDYQRLSRLLDGMPECDESYLLIDELERAQIVAPEFVPGNVVTMRSVVTFTVLSTQKTVTYRLAYPNELQVGGENSLSVLTPVGSALLGLSEGQVIEWPLHDNKTTQVRIDKIIYQPEAAGDLDL